ncbi:hypothetical protein [Porticoccus sp.]
MLWLVGLLGMFSSAGEADEFCLLLAETYHEQLYCELQALGQGQGLPPLRDFRRNDDMTQALILKRPAAKAGIKVVLPRQAVAVPARLDSTVASPSHRAVQHTEASCQLHGTELHCGANRFRLVGNRANHRLAEGVLGGANRMAIPKAQGQGVAAGQGALPGYLNRAYRQYLHKMLEIGLGGSTFSYRKFVYLFEDVTARGLDFSERFETMFDFLKRDKQRMSVGEGLPDTSNLDPGRCEQLEPVLVVCDGGHKNYLFRKDN